MSTLSETSATVVDGRQQCNSWLSLELQSNHMLLKGSVMLSLTSSVRYKRIGIIGAIMVVRSMAKRRYVSFLLLFVMVVRQYCM